jgi:3D (Asp-Asp-Asp) domain-containing protein
MGLYKRILVERYGILGTARMIGAAILGRRI